MLPENYIIDRIEELCKEKKMSRYRLAQRAGIAQSSISTLLNRKSVPTIQTINHICDGFGITLAQFFSNSRIDLTEEQQEILDTWDKLSEQDKMLVNAYIQGIIRK